MVDGLLADEELQLVMVQAGRQITGFERVRFVYREHRRLPGCDGQTNGLPAGSGFNGVSFTPQGVAGANRMLHDYAAGGGVFIAERIGLALTHFTFVDHNAAGGTDACDALASEELFELTLRARFTA